jgi:hypothetical protein
MLLVYAGTLVNGSQLLFVDSARPGSVDRMQYVHIMDIVAIGLLVVACLRSLYLAKQYLSLPRTH